MGKRRTLAVLVVVVTALCSAPTRAGVTTIGPVDDHPRVNSSNGEGEGVPAAARPDYSVFGDPGPGPAGSTSTPDNSEADPADAAGEVLSLPEPATLIIWTLLGGLFGLQWWRGRSRQLDLGVVAPLPDNAAGRRPWTDQNRRAIHQIFEQGRRRDGSA